MNDLVNEARYDQHAAGHQAKADSAYSHHGMRAPQRVVGESIDNYRRRLLDPLVRYSERWKAVNVATLGETALPVVEQQVFADAIAAVKRSGPGAGPLREVIETDQSGRRISKFYGDGAETWAPFKMASRLVTGWNTK